jgi:hypothetical protein
MYLQTHAVIQWVFIVSVILGTPTMPEQKIPEQQMPQLKIPE